MKSPSLDPISFARSPREVRVACWGHASTLENRIALAESEGYERGRADGERALAEQLLRQRADLQELQNGVLRSLANTFPTVIQDCEEEVVRIALESAQRIVAGLPIDRAMVEAVVREALALAEDTSDVSVLLHPTDLSLLERANAPLLTECLGGGRLQFVPSPEVTPGGCLVRTRFGSLDARRESKTETLRDAVQAR